MTRAIEHAAFLRTILEAPDDDAPRLVYADFLEEHGEAERAELIRIQCELERVTDGEPRRSRLQAREQELLQRHQVAWKNQLPQRDGVDWLSFRRGFVAQVRFNDPSAFLDHASEIFEATPVRHISLHRLDSDKAAALAKSPYLAGVRVLDLDDGNRIGNAGLEALAASPRLAGLEVLKVRSNYIGPA